MEPEEFEVLSGQIAALSSTIVAIICEMPASTAAGVLQQLEETNQSDRENDEPGSEVFASARDRFVAAYAGLLATAAARVR